MRIICLLVSLIYIVSILKKQVFSMSKVLDIPCSLEMLYAVNPLKALTNFMGIPVLMISNSGILIKR